MLNKNTTRFKGAAMLLLTAIIWGSAFIAQSVGMESIEPFTFSGIRMIIGCTALLPVIVYRDRTGVRDNSGTKSGFGKEEIRKGIALGTVFFVAQNLQQFAFLYSTTGKIAFITTLYMFFVPLLGLFLGKRVAPAIWFCVAAAFAGLYLLCVTPGEMSSVNRGDLLALGCSFFFAVHVLLIERFASCDGVKLSFVQFMTAGTLSLAAMVIFETPDVSGIASAAVPLLYGGIMSTGVAYTLQIIGQKYTEATVASLLLCTESVFALIFASLLLNESMNPRELAGCGIMFAAIVISQLFEAVRSGGDDIENHDN